MNDNDKRDFLNCLVGAAEITGKDLSEAAMRLYWESLKHLDIEAVKDAFNRHIVNPDGGQFMPKPADIIRLALGSTSDKSLQAWTKVDSAVRRVGPYESVVFDDPIIMAVIQGMGGWVNFCNGTEDDFKFKSNEFRNRYKGHVECNRLDHPPKLVGISEIANKERGLEVKEPMLLGSPEKAKLVYESGNSRPQLEITKASDLIAGYLDKLK